MKTFVVPIEGLLAPRRFTVGPVNFYPSTDELSFIDTTHRIEEYANRVARPGEQYRVVAVVEHESIDLALRVIEVAIQVLRAFQYGLIQSAHYTHFGLPGEITHSNIVFYYQDSTTGGYGFKNNGLFLGFELQENGIVSWEQHAEPLQFAASAINNPVASDGAKRALKGVELFAQSILVKDPDLRVLLVMASLEGMLKPDNKSSGTFILARKLAYLSCWNTNSCGQINGQPCPCIVFNPDIKEDRNSLKKIRRLSQTDTRWLCTYWAEVVEWYETRSSLAHGRPEGTPLTESSAFAYWSYREYLKPTLTWLMNHPASPTVDLDVAIRTLESESANRIDWHKAVKTGRIPNPSDPPIHRDFFSILLGFLLTKAPNLRRSSRRS